MDLLTSKKGLRIKNRMHHHRRLTSSSSDVDDVVMIILYPIFWANVAECTHASHLMRAFYSPSHGYFIRTYGTLGSLTWREGLIIFPTQKD